MLYIKQENGWYLQVPQASELFGQLNALPDDAKPKLIPEDATEIKEYFEKSRSQAKDIKHD